MGRLIDQVEDPALKVALENPVNPNEPKGLGTAATRDTILPKLQKSQYVELLKGKDPPIQVTEVGLAFMAAVRRVFPSYGDPVGRAMFEADLAEIGRAATRDEALRRAAAYQERTRTRVQELIGAIAQSEMVAIDPAAVPVGSATTGKPPTKAMVAFATSIAARKGLKLPRGLKSNGAICRAFLISMRQHDNPDQANTSLRIALALRVKPWCAMHGHWLRSTASRSHQGSRRTLQPARPFSTNTPHARQRGLRRGTAAWSARAVHLLRSQIVAMLALSRHRQSSRRIQSPIDPWPYTSARCRS
jgi:hypothetical protein